MSHVRTLLASGALALTGVAVLSTVPPAFADGGGRPLRAELTGAAEVPGPGDPDGTGTAKVRVDTASGEICYKLKVEGIDAAQAAHIHEAPAGTAGPVRVTLVAPSDGKSKACTTVDRALAQEISDNPSDYYVNVHNVPFPGGALRGQLG